MYHYRKTLKKYNKQSVDNKVLGCPFCRPETIASKTEDYEDFYLVENGIQYNLWEGHKVIDHLLLVPKEHIELLKDLTDSQRLQMMQIIGDYEARGYNIYARGITNTRRSVRHQHTHLIKIADKRSRAILFVERPYFLFDIGV